MKRWITALAAQRRGARGLVLVMSAIGHLADILRLRSRVSPPSG
jgi:hypothetical protein